MHARLLLELSSMSGAAARECAGSFSSVSSSTAREVEEEFQQQQQLRQYHVIKPLVVDSPPEMCNDDDGDLQRVTGPSEPPAAPPTAAKKKRSLPGTPDPSAEVVALSPRTLMATNRFVCEICHKGFQRDQNLQLHRRGHNLPWKLRQRAAGDGAGAGGGGGAPPRKRVYVCPEASCVHHSPRRALGDLTGIKKHYCRKHGEKKWKCERCGKRYAVHSDWKAHSKVCGTREYKCDCGTVFSRRDSFVTHRAFCDALAQENNKLAQPMNMATVASALQGHAAHHLALTSLHHHEDEPDDDDLDAAAAADDDFGLDTKSPQLRMLPTAISDDANPPLLPPPPLSMAGCLLSSLAAARPAPPSPATAFFSGGAKIGHLDWRPSDISSSMGGGGFSPAAGSASMSATALLQKAAEMGATTSGGGYGGGVGCFSTTVGFGPMFGGPDRLPTPFGPHHVAVEPYDGVPLGHAQLVGLDAGRLLPGGGQQQIFYGGGGSGGGGVGSMTRTIGSLMHGAQQQQMEHHRRRPDDLREVDYLGGAGVDSDQQRSFPSVSPFGGPHIGPWA